MDCLKISYDSSRRDPVAVALPLSKSMAARALIISAWQGIRPCRIGDLPVCTDTTELSRALEALLDAVPAPAETAGGISPSQISGLSVNLGLGGTSLRFFTAMAASVPGLTTEINCAEALARRPMRPLCEALSDAGALIRYKDELWHAPLSTEGALLHGGNITIDGGISSQYASAMMMCAPYWKEGLTLLMKGDTAVSIPYLRMTMEMMQEAGALVSMSRNLIRVFPSPYQWPLAPDSVEPDWSAASYFYALSLLLPDRGVRFSRLTPQDISKQGDSGCADIFRSLGVVTDYLPDGGAQLSCDATVRDAVAAGAPLNLCLGDVPDLVPALAVAMCLAGIRFSFTGIAHLRHKECDRMAAVGNELRRLGFILSAEEDSLAWRGDCTAPETEPRIATYGDHRMAMAFAPAAVRFPDIVIENPAVTSKSFPSYFEILADAGFKCIKITT